jgi:hypothetical protein
MKLLALMMIALGGGLCHAHAHAQVTCPWLTEGTAATALGGAPDLAVKLASPQEGSCVFTFENEAARSSLEITVQNQPLSTPDLSCPAGSPSLAGVGNSAVICHAAFSPRRDRQLVLSQVRHIYFSIALTRERKDTTMPDVEKQRDRITMIAEQVAGNLF